MKKSEKKKNCGYVNVRDIACRVIEEEAKGVRMMIEHIDCDFEEVVMTLFRCQGRIVVSGVGKSGIIASKMVATLNSTGTPSVFMHAADAMHGDLGIVQKEDIVLLISKSGNTQELKLLLPIIKQMGNIVVVMVSNRDSYLAINGDYVIYTPIENEACPNNLAPTTSTTVQLAMCDAIAISLSEMRGFTSDNFALYHPGGSLGKRLYMRVEDVFDRNNFPFVSENESIKNVIINISNHMLGATAVLDAGGYLKGIITDGDVRRMLEKRGKEGRYDTIIATDIMSNNPKIIDMKALAIDAFDLMKKNKITSVVVMEGKEYRGLIHIHDIIKEGIV